MLHGLWCECAAALVQATAGEVHEGMPSLQPVCGTILADSVSLNVQTGHGSRRLHIPQCGTQEDLADDVLTVLTAQLLKVTHPSQISLEQVAHDVSAAVFAQHALRQQKVQSMTRQKVRCTWLWLPVLHLHAVKQHRAGSMNKIHKRAEDALTARDGSPVSEDCSCWTLL